MKYLQFKDNESLSDVLLRQNICLITPNGIKLNNNHKYFYQMQHQMVVTGYHWGIFVACGKNGSMFKERVLFSEDAWVAIFSKSKYFFNYVVLPELAYPRVKFGLDRTVLPNEDYSITDS